MDPRSLPGGSNWNPESTQTAVKHERGTQMSEAWVVGEKFQRGGNIESCGLG